jgi:transcriptional regulator GlxA family with amidase domain
VQVEPDSIYVRDRNLYTSAGVTAGMDLALAMVEEDHGRDLAWRVARELVMFLKRPGGQSQFSAYLAAQSAERTVVGEIQNFVLANLPSDLTVPALATRANMSERNFARVFKNEAGATPAQYVERARIEAAIRILEQREVPLKKLAALVGYANADGLRRAFARRVGVSPAEYRQRFS